MCYSQVELSPQFLLIYAHAQQRWLRARNQRHNRFLDANCIPYALHIILFSDQNTVYNGFLRASDALTVSVQQSLLHSGVTKPRSFLRQDYSATVHVIYDDACVQD